MYAFVDTETTGFARGGIQPRIVSISWMVADNPAQPRVFKHGIIKPEGFTIPAGAAAVHGITTDRALAEGLPLSAVLRDFAHDLQTLSPRAIVAHNAAYDMPIIAAEFGRIRLDDPCQSRTTHCTMLTARSRWPGESAKLGDVYERLFRVAMKNAHNASADVWACAQIFFALQDAPTRGLASASIAPLDKLDKGEDCDAMVEAVIDWAARRPDFDSSFVESLQERLSMGRQLTDGQRAALRNIISRWNIRV